MTVEFSLYEFCKDFRYRRRFKKYLKKNIFLDTFAFCLIILGKFDYTQKYNTLAGDQNNHIFMNISTYKKLIRFVEIYKGRLIITPEVVSESLRHIFEAIENKYGFASNKKQIEGEFADFLQDEIKLFHEKHPLIKETLTHNWIKEIEHHKLRDRFEIGELSIFVESDKCKYNAIITKDLYKKNKKGEYCNLQDTIIIQLNILSTISL